jgi:hypothetical protein
MALKPKKWLRPLFLPSGNRKLHEGEGEKKPLVVTGVKNVRAFFRWLKEQPGGDCRKQGDKLVIMPNTAYCFWATVRMLRSIKASRGCVFSHKYLARSPLHKTPD